jgi:adenylosuccinate synthase
VLDRCGFGGERIRWGVLRCYGTRHGAGPFVSEREVPDIPEPHNGDAGWQGRFRVGHFDAVSTAYALANVGPLDGMVLTHLDRLRQLPAGVCIAYRDDQTTRFDATRPLPTIAADDLPARERLTRLLRRCRPIVDHADVCTSADRFVDWFEGRFARPVIVRSSGPTHIDKQLRSAIGSSVS